MRGTGEKIDGIIWDCSLQEGQRRLKEWRELQKGREKGNLVDAREVYFSIYFRRRSLNDIIWSEMIWNGISLHYKGI